MTDKNRTLIIDCQVLQTDAWDRGMGKYSLSLVAALSKNKLLPEKTILMLNNQLQTNQSMLRELKVACPEGSLAYLDLYVPSSRRKNTDIASFNKRTLDRYIDSQKFSTTVDFLILSLFLDQAFVVFPDQARKLLLFYDLIPFLFEKRYAELINYADYLVRFRSIFEADMIYTISQTVADDLAVYLGLPNSKLQNINGAAIKRSHLTSKPPDFVLPQKYILMNTGDDLRKNNLNAVKAFTDFNEQHGNEYTLIVTSSFTEATKSELTIYSDQLIFSGNVSEAQMLWLYENTELVLCPSEYEGLGLPVLEAMAANKKIACSNIPVFREISEDAFYYFDPNNTHSMATALSDALQGRDWGAKKAKYVAVMARYSWDLAAKDFDLSYHSRFSQTQQASHGSKLKVAIFTPHPSGYSAIGKLVAESHAALSENFDIDYYYDYQTDTHAQLRPDFLSYIAKTYKAADFTANRYRDYDAVIYNIGNSDYHLNTIKNALYLPGYIILHDTHLQGAFRELLRLGWITRERFKLEEMLNKKSGSHTSSFVTTLLNNQLGIITHSKHALSVVKRNVVFEVPVSRLNLPLEAPKLIRRGSINAKFNIGLAGILADVKGLPLIESLASDLQFQNCQFSIFGFSFIKPTSLDRLENLDNITIYRDPSDFEFQKYLANLDVLINYRTKYQGETSLTVLEAMRYGVVSLVRNIGWYSELPDEVLIKVDNETDLKAKLVGIKDNLLDWQKKREQAWQYITLNNSHQQYTVQLAAFIRDSMGDQKKQNVMKANLFHEGHKMASIKESLVNRNH